jgi:hypothetical protein
MDAEKATLDSILSTVERGFAAVASDIIAAFVHALPVLPKHRALYEGSHTLHFA